MGKKTKIKVKVKKRKLKLKRIFICLILLLIIVLLFLLIKNVPIKNIYIIGNNILSDKEIIEISQISNYPSFIETSKKDIIKRLEKNNYIKKVEVEKKFFNKIYIHITENKIISIYNNKLLLENGKEVENIYDIHTAPILISDISNIKEEYFKNFSKINDDILLKISEIEYSPN